MRSDSRFIFLRRTTTTSSRVDIMKGNWKIKLEKVPVEAVKLHPSVREIAKKIERLLDENTIDC